MLKVIQNLQYYGVYNMLERVDDHYVKRRVAKFGSDSGNLWKCIVGADFRNIDAGKIGPDSDDKDFPYELKENEGTFEEAAAQLKNFILNVSKLDDEDFYIWIQRVCDVELLLKTYAVNVAVGMWDDHWNNSNNFYIYFNSNSSWIINSSSFHMTMIILLGPVTCAAYRLIQDGMIRISGAIKGF